MADDDWRSKRAAELAGTPFARPPVPPMPPRNVGAGDATLPISRTAPAPPTPRAAAVPRTARQAAAAPAGPPPVAVSPTAGVAPPSARSIGIRRRGGWIAAGVAAVLCAIGLFFAARRLQPATPVTVAQPAPVAPRTPAPPVASPAVISPAPAAALPAPVVAPVPAAAPALPAAAPRPSLKRADHRPPAATVPRHKPAATKADPHRPAVKAKHKSAGDRAPRSRPAIVTTRPRDDAPVTAQAKKAGPPPLPICQPEQYSRAPRPCRPSHLRDVRKPFFGS